MSTILITGGTGFAGGRIARNLADKHSVWVSSRKAVDEKKLQAHGVTGAVLHNTLLSPETFPEGIDVVIHMAALNEWDCVKYPSEAIRVNIDETRIILENAIAKKANRFFYFSTAHVYGSPLKGEITETTLPVPIHPYAITHKAAEDYVVAAAKQKKINSTVFRLSNSFGAPVMPDVNRWTLLANDLCRQAIEKRKMVLLSNGCQFRDFICLTDVENVISEMIDRDISSDQPIYNLGSGIAMQVKEMACMIADSYRELFGKTIVIEFPPDAVPSTEPSLHYNIQRLLRERYAINNHFAVELKELLIFCRDNFKPA
jgi:UDP-glucose 4-epimerase